MSARAQDQLERLLLALPHLAEDTEMPIGELARQVGCDADTLLRDLEALTARDRDIAGHVESIELYLGPGSVGARTSHFRRPMRLTRAELAALDLGLGMLLAERPPEERATIQTVRARLREAAVTPPTTVQQGYAGARGAPADALPIETELVPQAQRALFGRLWQAHEQRQAVRLSYQRADAEAGVERLVHPWAIVRAHHHVYVVGWCATAGDVRLFRLDRIVEATLVDERYAVPGDFDVDSVLQDGRIFVGERPDDELVVRYGPRIARWIAEREGVVLAPDGSVTVSWPLADDEWAVRHVLQYGEDATVLAPERIAHAVIATLASLLPSDPPA